MWELTKKILRDQRGFWKTPKYNPPPAEPAPTEENTAAAAEEAAAKEREALKKRKRPTMLTGAYGVPGEASIYKAQLTGNTGGKSTLG